MFKDKNTIIGFTLLALLFFAYFFINSRQQLESQKAKEEAAKVKKRVEDSTAAVNAKLNPVDTIKLKNDSLFNANQKAEAAAGGFKNYLTGTPNTTVLENELVKITISNKGAKPSSVIIKKFNDYKGQAVELLNDTASQFGYQIQSGSNQSIHTSALFFTNEPVTKTTDGGSIVAYTIKDSTGKAITHTYTLKPNSYVADLVIKLDGANNLVTGNALNFTHNVMVKQQDNDKSYESQSSQFVYDKDGDYDYYVATETRTFDIDKQAKWFGYKQRFFSSLLFSNEPMKSVKVAIDKQADSSHLMYLAKTNVQVPLNAAGVATLQLYNGPNDYQQFLALGKGTKNIVQLHSKPFGFVKWINRGVVMPAFDWLLKNVGSVGLAIALLTLFIRILTAPLMFPGYVNSAKMKILRPDIDKLKEKYKDDQQGFAVEQMKFLRQAGVNQFAGCLPSLLQIPIFFALFALFTAHIGVRGESFLWAKDLSMYDDAIKLGFNLWPIGGHISIFALTASITSFLISWYSMSSMPDQGNPVLKYMPYFFPIIMFFIFNGLPSALTWYYTVSNVFALILQIVIQKILIKPEKLKAQIEENKKKVKPKSKFQERYEQMLEQQKKAQQIRK